MKLQCTHNRIQQRQNIQHQDNYMKTMITKMTTTGPKHTEVEELTIHKYERCFESYSRCIKARKQHFFFYNHQAYIYIHVVCALLCVSTCLAFNPFAAKMFCHTISKPAWVSNRSVSELEALGVGRWPSLLHYHVWHRLVTSLANQLPNNHQNDSNLPRAIHSALI